MNIKFNKLRKSTKENIRYCLLHVSFVTFVFQAKIWNSATNMSNYTVTIVTENLECDDGSLLVYGEQNIPSSLDDSCPEERLHFVGKKKILRLNSSSVNNCQNECVFRHICGDICYYVFISVLNVPDGSFWKICEVKFN